MNGLLAGFEIDFFFVHPFHFDFADFLIQGGLAAAGKLAVLLVLGLPLRYALEKRGRDGRILKSGVRISCPTHRLKKTDEIMIHRFFCYEN